jgi:hypothetical protein
MKLDDDTIEALGYARVEPFALAAAAERRRLLNNEAQLRFQARARARRDAWRAAHGIYATGRGRGCTWRFRGPVPL